jgi:hypothetical protein
MAKVRIKAARVPKSKKKVTFKVEIKGELNITAFVASQRVDNYLFTNIGNLLQAGEPDLFVDNGVVLWDVPVLYSLPDRGSLGKVGHLLVDAQNGDIKIRESTPVEEMKSHGERLYQQATSHTGA